MCFRLRPHVPWRLIFTILFLSSMPFNRDLVANRDFITYWATGQQLVHHGNPYDAASVSRIERDAGFQGGASYYMRNAPWALPLALPLGYLGPQAAALPWSLSCSASLSHRRAYYGRSLAPPAPVSTGLDTVSRPRYSA